MAAVDGSPGWLLTFSALRHRDFRWFFLNIGIQSFGQGIQFLGIGWLILDITGEKTQLGLAVSIFGAANLLFVFVGGVLADRVERRLFLIVCVLGIGSVTLALGVLALLDLVKMWHVFAAVFLLGGLGAMQTPARFALAADLVPREDIMNALALHTSISQIGNMVGPVGRRLGHRTNKHRFSNRPSMAPLCCWVFCSCWQCPNPRQPSAPAHLRSPI